LINEILTYDEGVAMVTTELLTVSKDQIRRAQIEHKLKYQVDWEHGFLKARREGEAAGEKRGEERGEKRAEKKYAGIIKKKDTALQEKDEKIQALEEERQKLVQKLRDLGLSGE
jgi:flagellar biosynthesis/type III secretory pathway protein FliH